MEQNVVSPVLLEYITTEQARGVPDESIHAQLLTAGWNETAVSAAFATLTPAPSVPVAAPVPAAPVVAAPAAAVPAEPVAVTSPTAVSSEGAGFAAPKSVQSPALPVAPTAHASISHEDYPVNKLRGYKMFVIFVFLNLALLIVGFWSLELLLATPFVLIHDPIVRKRFRYAIGEDGVYMYEGDSFEMASEKRRRFTPFAHIREVYVNQDWFDMFFGLAKVRFVWSAEQDAGATPKKHSWIERSAYLCGYQLGTLLPAKKCSNYRIPGLRKDHAEHIRDIIADRSAVQRDVPVTPGIQ